MTFSTVADIIKDLQRYYKDDDKILVFWWDKTAIEGYTEDLCLSNDRLNDIWEEAADYADGVDYGLEAISETITDAVSSAISDEEREHYGCIEVVVDGKIVHKEMDELPAESVEAIAETSE